MKRIIAILIISILAIGNIIPANATEKISESDEFYNAVLAYLEESDVSEYYYFDENEKIVLNKDYFPVYKENDSIVIFKISGVMCIETSEEIDGYIFNSESKFSESNHTGYAVFYNNKVYSIADSVKENIVTVQELADVIPNTTPNATEKISESDEFYNAVLAYLEESDVSEYYYFDENEKVVLNKDYFPVYKENNSIVIFKIDGVMCIKASEKIDGYIFYSVDKFSENNPTGYAVFYNNKIYSIADSVKENIVTVQELAEAIPNTRKLSETQSTESEVTEPTSDNGSTAGSVTPRDATEPYTAFTEPETAKPIGIPAKKANPMKVTTKTKTVK